MFGPQAATHSAILFSISARSGRAPRSTIKRPNVRSLLRENHCEIRDSSHPGAGRDTLDFTHSCPAIKDCLPDTKENMLSRIILLLSACLFCGCVSPTRLAAPKSPNSWETERFTVRFHAGPRSLEDQKTTSWYEVIPTRLGSKGRLIVRSEHSTGGFACVNHPAPANHIKVLPDSKSEALVIQETIPNDCGPCTNYIWIRSDGPKTFNHSYLQIPERPTGASDGNGSEFPEVVSIRDGRLTYRYSTGSAITVEAGSLPSAQEPTPPG